ncbi:hypothetical protein NEOLEDRAFT_1181582 [Neolentinus lepideus HHB14362 ss-1]|uniref:RTA1 like protein n=1 Tax=Neolentinus lepideus HHB14362 ss-1 TaxID=1314782 RepID=A0A165PW09_9AGAM|nr:hypothetical protein NEOLEDRAFT_1181582 [Neolentinus lepideus HHB14362 ss-1]
MFITRIILPLLMLAWRALADDTSSTDGVTLVYRVLHYNPSKAAAIIFGLLYLATGVVLFWRVRIYRDWWGLYLPIGVVFTAIGYFLRLVQTFNDSLANSLGIYIIQDFFILCSPAAFFAFNYKLYGQIVGGGGGLTASRDEHTAKLGNTITLIGLVAQAISYVFFLCVAFNAHYRVVRASPRSSRYEEEWWKAIWLLYFSSVPIIIRSIYRVAEFAQGSSGYLVTHEVYFYCLDALPLLIAVVCYAAFWPGQYIVNRSEDYKMTLDSNVSV